MKKIYSSLFVVFLFYAAQAQTPYQRVYTALNTKCQNAACHSATATDASAALKFDGTEDDVYNAIFNVSSSYASSVNKHERLVKPQHPYYSFLLRKVAGAGFDTDLAIDTATEGALMKDTSGNQLSNKEIEYIRQWIMFGAKKSYTNNEPQPNWQIVSDYYDNPVMTFLPKPAKPNPAEGMQMRMGPIFLPPNGQTEQEWMQQQEVNFPYLAEINKIDGFMNQQSHHFLLFAFSDSAAAVSELNNRNKNMGLVDITTLTTSFDGDKMLTASWQDDAEFELPTGTALFWARKTYLDMNYHVKNYNSTNILPTDFYFNIYFKPRNPNTIEMKSQLVNNAGLFLLQGTRTVDYDDPINNDNTKETRYLWALASHAHKFATDYDLYIRDTTGAIADKIYEGFYDYYNDYDLGYYSWDHPSIRYWPTFLPVKFGKHNGHNAGIVARTTWNVTQPFVSFGFTTNDEMQLFYYMYTSQDPNATTSVNDTKADNFNFTVMPNPMNNSGSLVYTLTDAAKVRASVVDVTGKEIALLEEENQAEGTHRVSIGNGDKLASGIYFARVTVNGNTYTQKFIVTE